MRILPPPVAPESRGQSHLKCWIRGLALLLGVATILPTSWAADNRPDILLILTDDMGWMDLRVQGNEKLHTPAIDRLAREGVRFPNAYAASPVCSPTRGALMTGLAPARLQITQHGPDQERFWPEDRVVQPPKTSPRLPENSVTIAETSGGGLRDRFLREVAPRFGRKRLASLPRVRDQYRRVWFRRPTHLLGPLSHSHAEASKGRRIPDGSARR